VRNRAFGRKLIFVQGAQHALVSMQLPKSGEALTACHYVDFSIQFRIALSSRQFPVDFRHFITFLLTVFHIISCHITSYDLLWRPSSGTQSARVMRKL